MKCESKFAETTAYKLGHIFRTPEIELVNKKAHFQPGNGKRKICHAKLMVRKFIAHVTHHCQERLGVWHKAGRGRETQRELLCGRLMMEMIMMIMMMMLMTMMRWCDDAIGLKIPLHFFQPKSNVNCLLAISFPMCRLKLSCFCIWLVNKIGYICWLSRTNICRKRYLTCDR